MTWDTSSVAYYSTYGDLNNVVSLECRVSGITLQVKPLEEDKAVAAGGNLLAEGFVYSLGASLSE